ncbi:hypothetical protein KAI87_03705 [Myxococcota bacterium]|nr:hypothetical protein [Myxococcota bacterium]
MLKKTLFITLIMMSGALVACGDDDTGGGDTNSCGDAKSCSKNTDCNPGDYCNVETECCELFGCTPGSCDTGDFCDSETLECKSIAEKCDFTPGGCDCFILNSAGELESSGDPEISMSAGSSIEAKAVLVAHMGQPLPGATFSFAVDDTALFSVSDATISATAATSGAAELTATPEGLSNPPTCKAVLNNLGDAPSDHVRFFVFNDLTGVPVEGAKIIVDTDGDGADDGVASDTDGFGLSLTTVAPTSTYTVTVFAAGYNYLSIVGLDATTDAGKDVALPMAARPQSPKTGGFTGRMDFEPYEKLVLGGEPKSIKFGLVSGSFPLQSIMNFDLDMFLGPMTDADCDVVDANGNHAPGCYELSIPGLLEDSWMALPGGLVLALTGSGKTHFDVVASAGQRFAWGLGGELDLADLTDLINILMPMAECACDTTDECDLDGSVDCACDTDCGVDINIGEVLNSLMPLFANFASAARGNLPLIETSVADWEDHIAPEYLTGRLPDANYPRLDDGADEYGQLALIEPLQKFTDFTVPDLPLDPEFTDGRKLEGMLVLTGVNTLGYGYVPLGLGVALDCTTEFCMGESRADYDGVVDGSQMCTASADPDDDTCRNGAIPEFVADGHLGLFHASPHSGLEGQEVMTLVVALPLTSMGGDESIRTTAFIVRGDVEAGNSTLMSSETYPGFPTMGADTAGRVYTVSDHADAHARLVTVAVNNEVSGVSTRWNIYFSGAATFTAPAVPTDYVDPFLPTVIPEGGTEALVDVTEIGFQLIGTERLADYATSSNSTILSDMLGDLDGFTAQNKMLDQ